MGLTGGRHPTDLGPVGELLEIEETDNECISVESQAPIADPTLHGRRNRGGVSPLTVSEYE